jgi:pSer/pThr/pTyr-binding forkhead associated (FHA) protein
MSKPCPLPRLIQPDGREIELTDQLTIGRSPDCSLPIEDKLASRRHALLEVAERQVMLIDLGSHNGTWLNDQKIKVPAELHDGDSIRIGRTTFQFKVADVVPAVGIPDEPYVPPVEEGRTVGWITAEPMTLVRSDDGAEIGLNRTLRIGRAESNDLVLKGDTSASQFHARIELLEGQVVISDQNSSNGTWVNGKRITGQAVVKHGDRIRLGNVVFRLRVGDRPLPPLDAAARPTRKQWVGWGSVGVIMLLVLIFVLPRFSGSQAEPSASAQTTPVPAISIGKTVYNKAKSAVVYVRVPVAIGYSTGSGSLLNEQGFVLTNYHVIKENEGLVLIGLNRMDPEKKPDEFYRCEVVKKDSNLDLAVLHVTASVSGDPFQARNLAMAQRDLKFTTGSFIFPYLSVGNSDELASGDPIVVIGFPGLAGDTFTLTSGTVSGFSPDESNHLEKGWIKTDTEINRGNSGGMAINGQGELVGVPTKGDYDILVVTEPATKKEHDLVLGKIGYIRPINLALPLIQEYLP